MAPKRGGPRAEYTFKAASTKPEELSESVVRHAFFHGFCTVKLDVKDALLRQAGTEARRLQANGVFRPTPEMVVDGLLGEEGSGRTAVLRNEDSDQQALLDLDAALSSFAQGLASCQSASELGVNQGERTAGMLHEAGLLQEDPPAMTEAPAAEWLDTFMRHRLMLILFLGPSRGVLELQPFDEDGNPLRLSTEQGMLAVVRADVLWRRFSSAPGASSFVLSCFLLQSGVNNPQSLGLQETSRMPVAEQLDKWMLNKIEASAKENGDDQRWSYALDHMYHKTQQSAVRGMACKFSVNWDPDTYWRSLNPGADYAVEVPALRWDHDVYYSEDPDCWKKIQVNCRHTSLVDGIELFDARFFRIAPAEVKGMDPVQRQILEVGYASLVSAGHTTRTLLQSLTGVFVGCPASEWALVDQGPEESGGCAQRSAGTGMAGSIMSNRFSFVHGMNGPSVTFDTDASTGLVILEAGIIALDEKRTNATCSACVGINCVLTPITWIARVGLGHMAPLGRCFTYDWSSQGWIKTELVGSMVVDRLTDTVEGVQVQDESKPYIGTIGSINVSHMGQATSMGTPHGPAVQRVVAEACRQACVSPLSIDAVETMGDGLPLNDTIEVRSLCKTLSAGVDRIPLHLASVKTNLGNGLHGAAMAQMIKVVMGQAYGTAAPMNHLRQIHPQLEETTEQNTLFGLEAISFQTRTSLVGVTAMGWGGTMGCAVCTGGIDPKRKSATERNPEILLWPGGGGSDDLGPGQAYQLTGSWDNWSSGVPMKEEEHGLFRATLEVGSRTYEEFRILVDGKTNQALQPVKNWDNSGSRAELSSSGTSASSGNKWVVTGEAGSKFRVELYVAGKWKVVGWRQHDGQPNGEASVEDIPREAE